MTYPNITSKIYYDQAVEQPSSTGSNDRIQYDGVSLMPAERRQGMDHPTMNGPRFLPEENLIGRMTLG
ncbi:MAG: hypothetical protein CM1200mP27_01770 [Chloroflexota bacterium]|nr:MAG: hypothetical protein CM1200mP27_01770 [Chloroflexota bacterium]